MVLYYEDIAFYGQFNSEQLPNAKQIVIAGLGFHEMYTRGEEETDWGYVIHDLLGWPGVKSEDLHCRCHERWHVYGREGQSIL